jgi:hypothetical protein
MDDFEAVKRAALTTCDTLLAALTELKTAAEACVDAGITSQAIADEALCFAEAAAKTGTRGFDA